MAFAAAIQNVFTLSSIVQPYLAVGFYSGVATYALKPGSRRVKEMLIGEIKIRVTHGTTTVDFTCTVDEEEGTFQGTISGIPAGTSCTVTPIYINGATIESGTPVPFVTVMDLVATPTLPITINFPPPLGPILPFTATAVDDEDALIDRRHSPVGTYTLFDERVTDFSLTSYIRVLNPNDVDRYVDVPRFGLSLILNADKTWQLTGAGHNLNLYRRTPAIGMVVLRHNGNTFYFGCRKRLRIRR